MHPNAALLFLLGGLLAAGEPTSAPSAPPPAAEAPAPPAGEPAAETPAAAEPPPAEIPAIEEYQPVVLPTIIGDETYLPPLPGDLARRYRKVRLSVEDLPDGRYIVRDGQGYSLDAHTFATLTNDASTQAELKASRKTGKRDALILAGVGGALAASAAVPLLFLTENDRPDPEAYLVDPDDFPDESSYLAAQAQSDAQYALALGVFTSAEGHNEDLRWTSLALVTGGSMLLFVAPVPFELAIHKQKPLHLSYTRDEVVARVNAYNRAVRARLGIPDPQPPAEPAPELQALPAPSGTKVIIQPFAGPGMIGVQGRF